MPALVVALSASGTLSAQGQVNPGTPMSAVPASRQFETRAQIEAQIRTAESQKRTGTALLLKSRLERGDFQEGDRIVVSIESGPQPVRDTMMVRTGKILQFPQMGNLSLHGILRAELQDSVRQHLAKYLTHPVVTAIPLLPVSVSGHVQAPGYYYLPADVVLRDVIMRAGGPQPNADLTKVVIRRNGEVIWRPQETRVALTDGLSLDGLHLRAGDDINVPQKRQLSFSNATAIVSAGIALLLAIAQLTN